MLLSNNFEMNVIRRLNGKWFTTVSILLGASGLSLILWVDMNTYSLMKEVLEEGDISPSIIAVEGLKKYALLLGFVGLILSTIGTIKRNRYKFLGFAICLVTIILSIIPIWIFLIM